MIHWVHAGVGVVTLLVLCMFMIIYIGVFSTVTTRICGAPLPGEKGERGAQGARGKAIYPGPIGPQSVVPGPTGKDGITAMGIMTGPIPPPVGTGYFTGDEGNTGWPGATADLLYPVGVPPINFRYLNSGVGSDLDQYQDTGFFSVTVNCNCGSPGTQQASVRFVRLGATVVFQVKQIVYNHGGSEDDWINFVPAEFSTGTPPDRLLDRFFFKESPFATASYVLAQDIIVYDRVPFTDGLFRLKITPNGLIESMRIQFRARYSPEADEGLIAPLNELFTSKFINDASTGTFGTATEFSVTWTLA